MALHTAINGAAAGASPAPAVADARSAVGMLAAKPETGGAADWDPLSVLATYAMHPGVEKHQVMVLVTDWK